MAEPTKRFKKLLREYHSRAYREELRRALNGLAGDFEIWKAGEISSDELNDRIHRFHNGTSRDIFKSYNSRLIEPTVARAIAEGILDRADIPAEILEYLALTIEFCEGEAAHSEG